MISYFIGTSGDSHAFPGILSIQQMKINFIQDCLFHFNILVILVSGSTWREPSFLHVLWGDDGWCFWGDAIFHKIQGGISTFAWYLLKGMDTFRPKQSYFVYYNDYVILTYWWGGRRFYFIMLIFHEFKEDPYFVVTPTNQ